MNLRAIREAAIAQVVAPLSTEELANVNENFVDLMANKGYHIVERRALWKFSEAEAEVTATAGQRAASNTPADLAVPLALWSNRKEGPLPYHDDRQRFFGQTSSGEVQFYGMWAGELRFYPLPKSDETFLLRYYKTWEDLVGDTAEPIIPATWHDLLVDYASYHLALRIPATGERFLTYSRAEPYLQSFTGRLEEMAASDLVMPTWDAVPNYGFDEHVLSLEGEAW